MGQQLWPTNPTMKMKPEELWPAFQSLPTNPRNNNQGRKVVTVNGKKYGLKGGFKREFLSNMTSPTCGKAIV